MSLSTILILLLSTGLAAAGQICLKFGSQGRAGFQEFLNVSNAAGLFLYLAGAALWMLALSRAPLQAVYPFTMLTTVMVGAASIYVFGEYPNAHVMAGWACVLVGLAVIGYGLAGSQ